MKIIQLVFLPVLACCSPAVESRSTSFTVIATVGNERESTLQCSTDRWHGRITIAPGLAVETRVPAGMGDLEPGAPPAFTVGGSPMVIESQGLRFGPDRLVPLTGEVTVAIRPEGIFVGGVKRAELPAK